MSFNPKDHFYKKAKKEQYLARSIYKLEEIDKKYKILKKGDKVIDLGYYPGSWIQYTSKKITDTGTLLGIDIKPINKKLCALSNVTLFEKDIFNLSDVKALGFNDSFNVVLSDMAPNTTGISSVDQNRSLNLVTSVFSLLPTLLQKKGNLIIKVFDSHDAQVFLKSQRAHFSEFRYLKPKSTRSQSKEFFVIGKGYRA